MDREEFITTSGIIIVVLALVLGMQNCGTEVQKTEREYIKAGYTQVQKDASRETFWVKPNNPNTITAKEFNQLVREIRAEHNKIFNELDNKRNK